MLNIVSRTKPAKTQRQSANVERNHDFSVVVWLPLIGAFLLADYAHSPKLQRYQLELTNYTEGIAKPQLLSKYCGDNVVTNLATTVMILTMVWLKPVPKPVSLQINEWGEATFLPNPTSLSGQRWPKANSNAKPSWLKMKPKWIWVAINSAIAKTG